MAPCCERAGVFSADAFAGGRQAVSYVCDRFITRALVLCLSNPRLLVLRCR